MFISKNDQIEHYKIQRGHCSLYNSAEHKPVDIVSERYASPTPNNNASKLNNEQSIELKSHCNAKRCNTVITNTDNVGCI